MCINITFVEEHSFTRFLRPMLHIFPFMISRLVVRQSQKSGLPFLGIFLINLAIGITQVQANDTYKELRYEAYDLNGDDVDTTYLLEHFDVILSWLGIPGSRLISSSPNPEALEEIRLSAGSPSIQRISQDAGRECSQEDPWPEWINDNGVSADGQWEGRCVLDVHSTFEGFGLFSIMVEASPTATDINGDVLVFDHWETEFGGDVCVTDAGRSQGRRYWANFRFPSGDTDKYVSPRADHGQFPDCAPDVLYKAIYAPAAIAANDGDSDLIADADDNCPAIANTDQDDLDADGIGDLCDDLVDSDEDGIANDVDNCPNLANPLQENLDADPYGDVCDADVDGDGAYDYGWIRGTYADGHQVDGSVPTFHEGIDNCLRIVNPEQEDFDQDLIGDACDEDIDGDDVLDVEDNCQYLPNPGQEDQDKDGVGDDCDGDPDGDGIESDFDLNREFCTDNCPGIFNPDQTNTDQSGSHSCGFTEGFPENSDDLGDACDPDDDGDLVLDEDDNCPLITNPGQDDLDADGIGDVCDQSATVKDIHGHTVAISLDTGVFAKAEPVIAPVGAPDDLNYKNGFFSIEITVVNPGDTVTLTVAGLDSAPEKVIKCLGTGCEEYPAVINADGFRIDLTDGGAGDEDGVANGVIMDPVGSATAASSTTEPDDTSGSGSGSGSGGNSGKSSKWYSTGCAIGSASENADPTLPVLMLLSLLVTWRRRAS